jgi:rod shape-determining protein MreC
VFNLNRKNLTAVVVSACLIFLLAVLIPAAKPYFLNAFRAPLLLLSLIRNEFKGVIFYHRNMVENIRLKNRIDFLNSNISELNELALENKRLAGLLSLKQKSAFKVIAARVIAKSPDNWSSLVIIDKGAYQGIRRGFVAINYLGLVGRVIETTEKTSKVILINDPSLSVSSLVQRSRWEGSVSGSLSGSLVMRYLPLESDIKVSDQIITSGLTDNYHKGIIIGTVVAVGEEFSGLSRYAIVKPAVDLVSLEELLVIIP